LFVVGLKDVWYWLILVVGLEDVWYWLMLVVGLKDVWYWLILVDGLGDFWHWWYQPKEINVKPHPVVSSNYESDVQYQPISYIFVSIPEHMQNNGTKFQCMLLFCIIHRMVNIISKRKFSNVMCCVLLCSIGWDERWLFALLILVELSTITV
jgi:hypothetical protein